MNQPPNYPPPPPGWTPPPPPSPARPRWGRLAVWTAGAAIAAFAIGGGLAVLLDDGGESIASETACREGLQENMRKAAVDGIDGPPLPAPAACYGLDKATLERITGEVMAEYLESPEAEKVFEDAMREALESAWPSTAP